MAYEVRILADSVNPVGQRLTTFEVTYPRFIHQELLTHRMLSRNSASSRAIPSEKLIQRVLDDPATPIRWGANQKGMQAGAELDTEAQALALGAWLNHRDAAVEACRELHRLGVHKQHANRLIEPWMFITVILSATDWANFFALRNHDAAQPEFRHLAAMMEAVYADPPEAIQYLSGGEWHMPLLRDEDENLPLDVRRAVSAARCARVSYLTHDGRRDVVEDLALHDRLSQSRPGHWSPFEHVARAEHDLEYRGNFCGWTQYRKLFADENINFAELVEMRAAAATQ